MVRGCLPKLRGRRWESQLIKSSKYFPTCFLLSASDLISLNLFSSFFFSLSILFSRFKIKKFLWPPAHPWAFKGFETNCIEPYTTPAQLGKWGAVWQLQLVDLSHTCTCLFFTSWLVWWLWSVHLLKWQIVWQSRSGTARLERDWADQGGGGGVSFYTVPYSGRWETTFWEHPFITSARTGKSSKNWSRRKNGGR